MPKMLNRNAFNIAETIITVIGVFFILYVKYVTRYRFFLTLIRPSFEVPCLGTVLHQLYSYEIFRNNILLSNHGLFTLQLKYIFEKLIKDDKIIIEVHKLILTLKNYKSYYKEINLQNCNTNSLLDFIFLIIECEEISHFEEINALPKKLNYNGATSCFKITIRNNWLCMVCKFEHATDQTAHSLLYKSYKALETGIKNAEIVNFKNCPRCEKISSRRISCEMIEKPKYLIIKFNPRNCLLVESDINRLSEQIIPIDGCKYSYFGHTECTWQLSNSIYVAYTYRGGNLYYLVERLDIEHFHELDRICNENRFIEFITFIK